MPNCWRIGKFHHKTVGRQYILLGAARIPFSQSFHAVSRAAQRCGRMSVNPKSSPLNSSGSPVAFASA